MYDDDLDALAAEYVLGTLASDERAHAEALIAIDPGFVEIVRQWERRLGELNVMVEAVEPPAEVWDKIKSGLDTVAPSEDVRLAPSQPTPPEEPQTAPEGEADAKTEEEVAAKPELKAEHEESEESPLLAALASTLTAEEHTESGAEEKAESRPPADWTLKPPSPAPALATERGAEVFYLARRLRRWRVIAVGTGAIAAVLAALIAVSQFAPELIPAGGFHLPRLIAEAPKPAPAPAPAPGNLLVAVLQQDPTAPAFLLTLDPASLTMTVRRVAAAADPAHSYELWLIAPSSPKPQSLGLVGAGEFTQRKLPPEYEVGTLRSATYKVSYEPAGGSKTGQPSGPILFAGKLVESMPPTPPPQPKT